MSYMAPEISNRDRYTGDKADIWSMGIVIYVLLVGFMPFKENDNEKSEFSIPNFVSRDASHFVSNMLSIEPTRRYSARKLLLHPWLSEMEDIPEYGLKNVSESSSDSDDQDEDGERSERMTSNFENEVSTTSKNVMEILAKEMKENGWNVRLIKGALRGSKMSLTGIVVVSIEMIGRTLQVRNANVTKDPNQQVMQDLSVIIKKVAE